MRISLNELSITSQKAALGVGVSVGAAEDLAQATAWLALRGLPVVRCVLDGLAGVDTTRSIFGEVNTSSNSVRWRSHRPDKSVSAALIGGSATDLLLSLNLSESVNLCIPDLDTPLLLLPYLATAATDHELSIRIQWADEKAAINLICVSDRVQVIQREGDPMVSGHYRLEVTTGVCEADPATTPQLFQGTRKQYIYEQGYEVNDADWKALGAFANRTLVKATERSRALGAGAGLSDND